jgi:hypothetical protein
MYSYIVYDENYTLKIYPQDPVHEITPFFLKRYLFISTLRTEIFNKGQTLKKGSILGMHKVSSHLELRKDEQFYFFKKSLSALSKLLKTFQVSS